jgi:hypothetical protein
MRKALIYFLIPFIPATSYAVCGEPQPRLVCAEYFRSEAVVEARLVRIAHYKPEREMDFVTYELQMEKTIHGTIAPQFRIWEENSSARASFDWKRGHSYLLFLRHMQDRDAWELDGCGNSALLERAALVLKEIEKLQDSPKTGLIHGAVDGGLEGVQVSAQGSGQQYKATSDKYGRFHVDVPQGHYRPHVRQARLVF